MTEYLTSSFLPPLLILNLYFLTFFRLFNATFIIAKYMSYFQGFYHLILTNKFFILDFHIPFITLGGTEFYLLWE